MTTVNFKQCKGNEVKTKATTYLPTALPNWEPRETVFCTGRHHVFPTDILYEITAS